MNDFTNAETAAQLARWTPEHSAKAMAQGWDMFDYDTMGLLELECDSEAEIFSSDQEAYKFVERLAYEGDETAKLAIELDQFFQPIIDRVREANAALNARRV